MRCQDLNKGFSKNCGGTVAMIFSLTIASLFGVVGLAIDASRSFSVSNRVASALDTAALAAAKLLDDENATDSQIIAKAQSFFQSHASTKSMPGLQLKNFNVTIDRASNKVSVDVDVLLPTTFAQVLGFSKFDFNRKSEVVFKMRKIELAMVLDITGSMNDGGKLASMKAAASDVIDNLMNGSSSENAVRIAVAPFSASVNAGALANKVSSSPAVTSCGMTWYGAYECSSAAGQDVDTCVIERNNSHASSDDAPTGVDILPAVPSTPYGNYNCPSATVIPLLGKSSAPTIKTTINSYVASGATAGHIGAAWGWYLLSPKWSSILPGVSAPAAYADKEVSKYVIFLTDGIFNTSYISGGSTAPTTQVSESYTRFQTLCTNMKAAGVTVFTVALDLLDARSLTELQTCGGANSYTAATGTELRGVFHQIVSQLNTLRIAG